MNDAVATEQEKPQEVEASAVDGVVMRDPGHGYCPVCEQIRQSLPAPAEGCCSHCYNHLMKTGMKQVDA